jgi:hypothetical protein
LDTEKREKKKPGTAKVRRLKEEQLHLFDRVATKSHRRHAGRHQMQLFSVSVCGLLLVLRLFCYYIRIGAKHVCVVQGYECVVCAWFGVGFQMEVESS